MFCLKNANPPSRRRYRRASLSLSGAIAVALGGLFSAGCDADPIDDDPVVLEQAPAGDDEHLSDPAADPFGQVESEPAAARENSSEPGELVSERLAALSSCPPWTPRPREQKIDYDARIDGVKFVEAFRKSVGDNGMGYVVVLQNDRRSNVATDTYGWAISPCDPEGAQPWTVDTASKIGSVSKLVTTASVIKAAETGFFSIEDSIESALPARWRLHPDFRGLRWSEILGHRAGFRRSAGVSSLGERLQRRLSGDPPRGEWQYSNTLGAAGVLMYGGIVEWLLHRFDRNHADESLSRHDEAFNRLAQDFYIRQTKGEVLDPAGARLASCRLEDAKDQGRPFARSYTSKSDPFGDMGQDNSLSCPSGGWQMSARGLMRFIRTLRHTDAIISRAGYANMTRMFRADDGELKPYMGFDGRDGGYRGGFAFDKNGSVQNYKTYVAMLPHGYTLVAMSNSADLGTSALESAAKAAWNAGYK